MKDRIFDAIDFAVKAHRGQSRKGSHVPYIVHPIGVSKLLIEAGCEEDIVIAGLLHDTLEDTPVTVEDLKVNFGEKIAEIVSSISEPDKKDTWEHRKTHTIEYLKTAPVDSLLVECADKLDNIRAIRQDFARLGDGLWSRFKRGFDKQKWYYMSLMEAFALRSEESPELSMLFKEFKKESEEIFKVKSEK
jgi:(p)ppGpp synthase/HD superfamily hydrolase